MSDPTEMSVPRDPGSYGRARPAGRTLLWLLAFGVACAGAGYGFGKLGPGLPAPPGTAQPAATGLFGAMPLAAAPAPAVPEPAVEPPAAAPSAEVTRLNDRLEALEDRQGRAAEAAAAALAAAALMEAAQTSRPFAGELAALEAAAPGLGDLRALRPYAGRGVPSVAALAASFPDYAAHAASAARVPAEDAGLLPRIGQALSRVVTLRRVGDVAGDGPDALLARAERQVEDGDLLAALATLDRLPPPARAALAPWRTQAEGRAVVERQVADLRGEALRRLTELSRSGA